NEIAALPGVTQVVGNSHKHQLAEIAAFAPEGFPAARDPEFSAESPATSFVPVARLAIGEPQQAATFVSDIFAHTELLAAPVFDAANERTRPNLKVQDGCDNRCSFCVIPYVRGQSRSPKLDQVIREVKALVDAGYREVVISGINLGRWGRDLPVVGRSSSVVGKPGLLAHGQPPITNDERLEFLIHAILDQTP